MFSELRRLQSQPLNLSAWQGSNSRSVSTDFYAVRYRKDDEWVTERLTFENAFQGVYKQEFELRNLAYIASNYNVEYSDKLYNFYDYVEVYKKYLLVILHNRV